MYLDKEQLRKALVGLSIEKVLLDLGKPVYDKVVNKLSKDYNCYLPDCYEYPENLNLVLKKIFGESYVAIADAIKKELGENLSEKPIEVFATIMSR